MPRIMRLPVFSPCYTRRVRYNSRQMYPRTWLVKQWLFAQKCLRVQSLEDHRVNQGIKPKRIHKATSVVTKFQNERVHVNLPRTILRRSPTITMEPCV